MSARPPQEDRERELAALLEISRALSSTLQLDELLNLIIDELKVVVPYSGAGVDLIVGDEVRQLAVRRPPGYSSDPAENQPILHVSELPESLEPLLRNQPVHIGDVLGDSEAAAAFRADWQVSNATPGDWVRSLLLVPMFTRDTLVGSISVVHAEPNFYNDEHVRVVHSIAGQAALAVTNARLYEGAEQRTQEMSALLEISRVLASNISLRGLVQAILEQLKTVIDYTGASVVTLEADGIEIVESMGPDGREEDAVGRHFQMDVGSDWYRSMSSGEVSVIPDVQADDELARAFRAAFGDPLQAPHVKYIRSWIGVPLTVDDRVVGLLSLSKDEPEFFTQRHLDLVQTVARQAAVVAENARLFEQTQAQTRELSALLEVSRALSSTLDLTDLLRVVLTQLKRVVDYTGASVNLIEDATLKVLDAVAEGPPPPRGAQVAIDERNPIWQAARENRVIVIADAHDQSDPVAVIYHETMTRAGWDEPTFQRIRSWMSVPLVVKDNVIGTLSMSRNVPGYFTENHQTVARAFAEQAALAIENARLFDRTQTQTRDLAALLDVSRAMSSTLELAPLLDVILDRLQTMVEYHGAAVMLGTGGTMRQLAVRRPSTPGYPDAPDEVPRETRSNDFSIMWRALNSGQPILIDDVWGDSEVAIEYRGQWGGDLRGTRVEYVHSFLAVPLAVRGETIGNLALGHSTPGHFQDEHASVAQAFAELASLAIENARLFEETQRRGRETEALFRSDEELFRSLDPDVVLQALVDVTVDLLGAEKSMVAMWDADKQRVTLRASRNFSDQALSLIHDMYEQARPGMENTRIVVTEDPAKAHPLEVKVIEHEGIQSFIQVPVMSDGFRLGFFSVAYTTEHHFSDDEQRLLSAVADRAAVAISNADLHTRARHATALEERQRLARELHDSVSQALYGIALGARTARTLLDREPAKAAEPLDYVLSLAEAGLAEMRALIFELRPESLESEGLIAALEKQVAATSARYGIAIAADLGEEPDVRIEAKECLYRIGQEALHNMVKHARATEATVTLSAANGHLELTIVDNGQGFDPAGDFAGHLGLRSMRERAESCEGTVTIESAVGAGATIRASIPA